MNEPEISVASIPVEERMKEVLSKSRKRKMELKDLQVGVKYHKIHHKKSKN